MDTIYQDLTLDFMDNRSLRTVKLKQNENGARKIRAALTFNGVPIMLAGSESVTYSASVDGVSVAAETGRLKMNLLERIVNGLKKIKQTWITPPESERKPEGFVQLRTADGKTTITVSLADNKDAHKAKQLVNLALGDTNIDYTEPYALENLRMGE